MSNWKAAGKVTDFKPLFKGMMPPSLNTRRSGNINPENDPLGAGFVVPAAMGSTYSREWLNLVQEVAAKRTSLDEIPLYGRFDDDSDDSYYHWREELEDSRENFYIQTEDDRIRSMKQLDTFVATMLLAFPIGSVHVSVIERSTVNSFINSLPARLCQKYDFARKGELVSKLKELYRDKNATPCVPREIVIMTGYTDEQYRDFTESLTDILNDGHLAGIYFMAVTENDYDFGNSKLGDTFGSEPFDCNPDFLDRNASVTLAGGDKKAVSMEKLLLQYLEEKAKVTKNKVRDEIANGTAFTTAPVTDLSEQPKSDRDTLAIPYAESADGETMNLNLNTDHFCAFIIGRSGSGKSFMLHSLLTGLMLKYGPEAVDVTLMDFKEGGVEMNCYKDVPHVGKLLVNGADKQIVREILHSVEKEMERRGELFQQSNTTSINTYNDYARKNGKTQLKHIVLLADECHKMFENDRNEEVKNIITKFAREGRSQGVHMIFATQLLRGSGISNDAIKQFSDFLLMASTPGDVEDCGITDKDIKASVDLLGKGEVIHYSGGRYTRGFVYNYAGENGVYRDKTLEHLHSDHFSKADTPQFYFNASQVYHIGQRELDELAARSSNIPTAILGHNLSVRGEALVTRFKKAEGCNLLIMGANSKLQAERVLWNAVTSLYYSHKQMGRGAQFKILSSFPDEVEDETRADDQTRHKLLKQFGRFDGVEIIGEDDRSKMLEQVAATVRHRMARAEADSAVADSFTSIYLVMPNQDLLRSRLGVAPKGLLSLEDKGKGGADVPPPVPTAETLPPPLPKTDSLGFASLNMGTGKPASKPAFAAIDMGGIATPPPVPSPSGAIGTPATRSRSLDEELQFILSNGPSVRIHVLLQASSADKIFSGETLRPTAMCNYFNDIVMLRMKAVNVPDGCDKFVEKLDDKLKSLRALAYNGVNGMRTMVPFDFPEDINTLYNNGGGTNDSLGFASLKF